MQAPKNLLRQLSDLDQLFESLGQDTGEILTMAFPAQDIARTAAGGVSFDIGLEGMGDAEVPEVEGINRARWVRAGVRAVTKLKDEGETADITGFDLALFTAEPISSTGTNMPEPLALSTKPQRDLVRHRVNCVSYPTWDGQRNDPEIMRNIFSNIFNVKRLQPGRTMPYLDAKKLFMQDCSKLGGNSGSSILDLETNQVIVLHFCG
jgi:hypothetical protein